MSKVQSLNKETHKHLKVIEKYGYDYEASYMSSITFPSEIRQVQAYYPVFFQKDPSSGRFIPVALYGFEQGENLFQTNDGWLTPYVPISVQRSPFSISRSDNNLYVSIDVEHKKVSKDEGVSLFTEAGIYSPYLKKVTSMLEALHHGMEENEDFINLLMKFNLIESLTLDIVLDNGTKNQLIGFFTINEESLSGLSDENYCELRHSGYLETIYMMIASQSQIARLLALKNSQQRI